MKKLFFVLSFCTGVFITSFAQVSLQPTIPAIGMVQKNQLWNVLLVNNTSNNYTDCRLSLVLTDRGTGQELLTATTSTFSISSGAKQINANLVAPIQYNNLQTGIDNKFQGLLPVGSYTACYVLSGIIQKEQNLAEECVSFDVEPLSPPMLIFPSDSSILEVAPSQFSWIPPTPDGMFNGLHYEVMITPINDGQKAGEAIQENLPFYNDGNQIFTTLNYPPSMPTFEKQKWYAWQVIAKDNGNYAGKSEVWVFKVRTEPIEEIIKMAPYLKVENKPKEVSTLHQGILKIEYYNFLTDSIINLFVYDEKQTVKESKKVELKITPGQNYLQYDLYKKMHLSENTIYEILIVNSKEEKYYLKVKPKNYR